MGQRSCASAIVTDGLHQPYRPDRRGAFSVGCHAPARILNRAALKIAALGTGLNLMIQLVVEVLICGVTHSATMPCRSDEEGGQVPAIRQIKLVTPDGNCGAMPGGHDSTGLNSVASPVRQRNSLSRDWLMGIKFHCTQPPLSG